MTMKKILAMLLALSMLFCFAACGGDDDDDDDDKKPSKKSNISEPAKNYPNKLDEDSIVGTWNIVQKFSEQMALYDENYADFFEENADLDFNLIMSFEFGSKGTVKLTQKYDVTEKQLKKLAEATKEWLLDGAIYDIEDMDAEEFEEYLYEYEDGMDIEEYIDEYYTSDFDDIAEEIAEEPETLKLNYEFDDDRIYIAMDEDEDIDEDYYWEISYKKGVITITKDEIGGGTFEDMEMIYGG